MNYSGYLQLNKLLTLQQPLSPASEHRNENLFIITHQTYELWFRQLILEIHYVIDAIDVGEIPTAIDAVQRVNAITQTIVNQISVIRTLKYHEFQRFRSYLGTSSGLQSWQFAGIEAILGKVNQKKMQQYNKDSAIQHSLEEIIRPVSLWQAVKSHLLKWSGISGIESRDIIELIKTLLEKPSCESLLLNHLLDLDALLQEWRYQHVKLVERTIGLNRGTGGTSGLDYLKATLFTPIFEELWEAFN